MFDAIGRQAFTFSALLLLASMLLPLPFYRQLWRYVPPKRKGQDTPQAAEQQQQTEQGGLQASSSTDSMFAAMTGGQPMVEKKGNRDFNVSEV